MTLHSIVEYLKYRWKAKGRHGTHSPFVYDLVENVLLNKAVIDRAYLIDHPGLSMSYENLISRIASYYKYRAIVRLPTGDEAIVKDQADMLLIGDEKPKEWISLMDKYYYLLNNNSAIIVIGIHKTTEHTKWWAALCADPRVRMSIDLYGIGILFFKEEFKEPQQFVLKYY